MSKKADPVGKIVAEKKKRPKPYHDLRPGLFDIRFSYDLLSDTQLELLEDDEYRAFMRLVAYSAASIVWTYSSPSDGIFPHREESIERILRARPGTWPAMKAKFIELRLIRESGGNIYLAKSFHALDMMGIERPAMPPALRLAVLRRDDFTCGYCGTTQGPFDVDHIIPIARGGANTDENLICACARCNRSKSDKTIDEWMGKIGGDD